MARTFVDFKAPVMAMSAPLPPKAQQAPPAQAGAGAGAGAGGADAAAKGPHSGCPEFVVVGGGGGMSKTGVLNYLNFYTLAAGETNGDPLQLAEHSSVKMEDMVTSLAVSPKGNMLAVGCGFSPSCSLFRCNFNAKDKSKITTAVSTFRTDFKEEDSSQNVVAFDKSGEFLASGGEDGCVRLWKVKASGAELVHEYKGHKRAINSVCFHPAGNLLVSASNDDTVKLWNTAGKACLATIKGVGSAYTKGKYKKKGPWKFCAARFSKDGSSIFALESTRRPGGPAILCQYGAPAAGWSEAGSDVAPLVVRTVDKDPVVTMVLSPDGNYIGLGGSQGKVFVYQVDSLRLVHRDTPQGLAVTSLVFAQHARGLHIVTGSADRTIATARVQSGVGMSAVTKVLVAVVLLVLCAAAFWGYASVLGANEL